MKNKIYFVIVLSMFISLHYTFAQVAAKKGWDGTIKGGTIHLESDQNGKPIISLPCEKPTVLCMNEETKSFDLKSPRDVASGLPTGKRLHKPFTISKFISEADIQGGKQLKFDENGDCDISSLEPGTYQVCSGDACFKISTKCSCSSCNKKQYIGHVTLLK
jgi:hypothetical protein